MLHTETTLLENFNDDAIAYVRKLPTGAVLLTRLQIWNRLQLIPLFTQNNAVLSVFVNKNIEF